MDLQNRLAIVRAAAYTGNMEDREDQFPVEACLSTEPASAETDISDRTFADRLRGAWDKRSARDTTEDRTVRGKSEVVAALEDACAEVLPLYCADVNMRELFARAASGNARVRDRFDREARSAADNADPRRADMLLTAAEYAYVGMKDKTETHTFCYGRDILRERRVMTVEKLTAEQFPEPLGEAYREEEGRFDCEGLKVFCAFVRFGRAECVTEASADALVLGFCGTMRDVRTMEADLAQAIATSAVYVRAVGFVRRMLACFPSLPMILTGHSLGGGLAQFALAANVTEDNAARLSAYCFNSAGLNILAYDSLKERGSLSLAARRVVHYVVRGEPVSRFFGQIGGIVTLDAPAAHELYALHRISTVRLRLDAYAMRTDRDVRVVSGRSFVRVSRACLSGQRTD